MICKVKETLRKFSMLENTDIIVVGFSGGADSTALLHALISLREELGFSVFATHINHCLRGKESDRDEAFVRDFCKKYDIDYEILKADIINGARNAGMGIEEYARKVRYENFEFLARKHGAKIATAHNLNDCEETMIFNLTRGSGLKGLSSIPPVRDNIIRPLIECTREEIENYCKENSLSYVTDSSNLTDDYTRNNIRHNIIPILKEINPSFDYSVLRCLTSLREDEEYLKTQADKLYNSVKLPFGFNAKLIKSAPNSLQYRVISRIIYEKTLIMPERKHIELVKSILSGGKVQLMNKTDIVVRDDILYFIFELKKQAVYKEEVNFINGSWKNKGHIVKSKNVQLKLKTDCIQKVYKDLVLSTFDYDKIVGKLILRKREDGDKITLPLRKVTKSLKKLFNELKIPPESRDSIAVLSDDIGVVWIEGVGCDLRVAPDKNTENFVDVKISGDDKCLKILKEFSSVKKS